MTDKEIDKQIEKLKKSIAADKADNSWHFIGAPPYIIGADLLDELFKRLEEAKSESAALREKLAAAKIPKEFEQTVEKLKQALALGGYPDLISAASYVLQMWDAWRGKRRRENR